MTRGRPPLTAERPNRAAARRRGAWRSAVLLAATAGCVSGPPPPVVYDLVREAPAADLVAPWKLTLFGTPDSQAREAEGFVATPGAGTGDTFARTSPLAAVSFDWANAAERVASIDLASDPRLGGQDVEVTLNQVPIGTITIGARRARFALTLSAAAQRVGRNRIELRFSDATRHVKTLGTRLAGALYAIAVGRADDAATRAAMAAGAPPLLSTGGDSVLQAGPSALRYVLRAPARAELHFGASLLQSGRQAARGRLKVTVAEGPGPARAVWSLVLGAGGRPRRYVAKLPAAAGALFTLSFEVEALGSGPVWGLWSQPRLRGGDGGGDPFDDADHAPEEARRADGLRQGLAGLSVVYVILDAAGARHFSSYGYPRATTPHIDALAREGVLFENAFTVAGFTLAAMRSAFTSSFPQELAGSFGPAKLPRSIDTLAERVASAGIRTGAFVANDLAGAPFGFDQGFETFLAVHRRYKGGASAFRRALPPWLDQVREQRFFAYVHFREPHFAYDPPAPFDSRFGRATALPEDRRRDYKWLAALNAGEIAPLTPAEREDLTRWYDGALAYVDAEVGALVESLRVRGLLERSVLIVSADHGEELAEHGYVGHLRSLSEEVLRIPLIVRFPRAAGRAGLRVPAAVDIVDIAPTILDVFGLAAARPGSFQGRSLLPIALGAPGWPALLARNAAPPPRFALRRGALKLIDDPGQDSVALYDVAADPQERHDLSAERPLEASYYRQALRRRLVATSRESPEAAGGAELTEEQKEVLRSLGYLR